MDLIEVAYVCLNVRVLEIGVPKVKGKRHFYSEGFFR